jgi:hypothetical protein
MLSSKLCIGNWSNDLSCDVHLFRRRDGEPDPAVPGDGGAAGGGHQGGRQLGDPGRLAARPGRPGRSSGARLHEVSHVLKIIKKKAGVEGLCFGSGLNEAGSGSGHFSATGL